MVTVQGHAIRTRFKEGKRRSRMGSDGGKRRFPGPEGKNRGGGLGEPAARLAQAAVFHLHAAGGMGGNFAAVGDDQEGDVFLLVEVGE
jgi:hypothetical protein